MAGTPQAAKRPTASDRYSGVTILSPWPFGPTIRPKQRGVSPDELVDKPGHGASELP